MLKEKVAVKLICENPDYLPLYASDLAAGADVKAAIDSPIELGSGESRLIPTGLRVEIPEGFEIQVRPRSGLAYKHQITVLNSPGTIDADYRGVIGVILINHGKEPFLIEPKMRIAQIVLAPVCQAVFVTDELSKTSRGAGGFGHTGIV